MLAEDVGVDVSGRREAESDRDFACCPAGSDLAHLAEDAEGDCAEEEARAIAEAPTAPRPALLGSLAGLTGAEALAAPADSPPLPHWLFHGVQIHAGGLMRVRRRGLGLPQREERLTEMRIAPRFGPRRGRKQDGYPDSGGRGAAA